MRPDPGFGPCPVSVTRAAWSRVDADRFLVARLIVHADVDEIAGLQHLFGRLGEARLVAIDRLDAHEAGEDGRR